MNILIINNKKRVNNNCLGLIIVLRDNRTRFVLSFDKFRCIFFYFRSNELTFLFCAILLLQVVTTRI